MPTALTDLPREKLLRYGPEKLTETELISLMLNSGNRSNTVQKLSQQIIKKISLPKLPHANIETLRSIAGIGPAKAAALIAAFELSKRLLEHKKVTLIMTADEVWQELRDIRNRKKEHFVIFLLDARNQEIRREIISIGSLNASLVHPREVFELAIKSLASQIMLAHNHPSGDPTPSDADIQITQRLIHAGQLLGIEVIDHVIVTAKHYFSFREHQLLDQIVEKSKKYNQGTSE